jgi:Amt family ammonium transporter
MLLKERLRIDDALDVSSVHGVTGIVGTLAVGLIASSLINPAGPNGLIYGNPIQIGLQALGVVSTAAFSFGGTIIIIKLLDKTIGLRVKGEQEEVGLDLSEHAEKAYL